MSQKELQDLYDRINKEVHGGELRSALLSLQRFTRETASSEYFYELENLTENYRTLLKYFIEGYRDPKEKSIRDSISASILSMADQVQSTLMLRFLPMKRADKARLVSLFGNNPEDTASRVDEFLFGKELTKLIEESDIPTDDRDHDSEMEDIFKLVWLTEKINEYHTELARKICDSETVSPWDKSLIVSALTLSLLSFFDVKKFLLLIDFIEKREHQVYQRALTGVVLALIRYDDRLPFYPVLGEKLASIAEDETLAREMELVFMQFLTAKETERITREFETEVLPEMKKMMPRIEDKLELGELEGDPDMDEKNPGWKELIEETPGLFEKIEKFSRMQMEGADVFMGTFSLLKRFDFFNSMSHWFVPFYKENPVLERSFPPDESYHERLFDGLEKAFYICNSDKYSFALNFVMVPAQQRSMLVSYFEAELGQMKEMVAEEQLLDQSLASNAVIVQYIQDLYRFYKLFPNRSEFQDIFLSPVDLPNLWFYRTFFESKAFLERVGSFYFEKEHWNEAISVYTYLTKKTDPRADFFEKTAYAYQMLGDFEKAVDYYRKAELFDTNRRWILTKLGWCCSRLQRYDEAIGYFTQALELKPDDLKLQLQIAKAYINKHDYSSALQIYTRFSFFDPSNMKVMRPYAFSLFALGKLEQAEEVYKGILETGTGNTMYDYMNAGHVKLCLGKKQEAIDLYKNSTSGVDHSWSLFFRYFEEDRSFLEKNGIQPADIRLVLDYLMFSTEKE